MTANSRPYGYEKVKSSAPTVKKFTADLDGIWYAVKKDLYLRLTTLLGLCISTLPSGGRHITTGQTRR